MFGMGPSELAIIALIIVVFIFGGEKLSGLARGLGRFTGEFKKGKAEVDEEINKIRDEFNSKPNVKRNENRKTEKRG